MMLLDDRGNRRFLSWRKRVDDARRLAAPMPKDALALKRARPCYDFSSPDQVGLKLPPFPPPELFGSDSRTPTAPPSILLPSQ